MKYVEITDKIKKSGFKLFSAHEFQRILGLSPISAKFLLIRYAASGIFVRVKRNLYALKDQLPSTWMIANHLYKPSFISMESALSYYGMIPESLYAVTSLTTKPTRLFEFNNISYYYHTIQPSVFGSYRVIPMAGESVLVAEKEKALADYLYFVFLKQKTVNARLRLKDVNRKKVIQNVTAYKNVRFLEWFKHDLRIPNQ